MQFWNRQRHSDNLTKIHPPLLELHQLILQDAPDWGGGGGEEQK